MHSKEKNGRPPQTGATADGKRPACARRKALCFDRFGKKLRLLPFTIDMLPTSAQIRSPIRVGKIPGSRFPRARPLTPTLAYIVAAPFLTGILLALHSWWGLFILFGSHVLLILHTLLPRGQGFGPIVTRFETAE